jgi:hypothetical protein
VEPVRPGWQSIVAATAAIVLYLAHSAGALPWPAPSGPSLAALFLLVAFTRIAGRMGVTLQKRLRYAVAGIAIAAGSWFSGIAVLGGQRELLVLGALHIAAAWLAAYGEPDPHERRIGGMVLVGAMLSLSVIALGAPPDGGAGTALTYAVAGLAVTATLFLARDHAAGVALAGLAGGAAVSFAVARGAAWLTAAPEAGGDAFTPMVSATALVSGAVLLIAFARAVPALWARFAPGISPASRRALAVATAPACVAFGAVLSALFA